MQQILGVAKLIFINCAAMGRARFLIYPWFIFFCHVGQLNQTSVVQNSNDATYDVQGQEKCQIAKSRRTHDLQKNLFKTLTSKRYTTLDQ